MSDLFQEGVPDKFIQSVFETMETAGWHQFQLLTKRPERAVEIAHKLRWPANVWMGTSIENRRFVARADQLRKIPAAVRFISAEPLLGPLDRLDLTNIDWLIAGGESGRRHRPMKLEWVQALRDLCSNRNVRFFFKQWGGAHPKTGGRLLDGREWSEMPVVFDESAGGITALGAA